MWKISKVKRKDKNSPKESPDTQAKSAEGAENDLNAGSDDKKAVDKTGIVKKVIYAVVSLFLAMLLWGYVLMDQNPDREKTVTNITPTFESGAVADLDTRKLTIYGNISEILQKVNVTVSAPLTDVMRIDENNIAATVSLTDVHEAGTYELEVKATSNIGRVTSVEPSKITVTVDDVIIRNVPVKWDIVGTMPRAAIAVPAVASSVVVKIFGQFTSVLVVVIILPHLLVMGHSSRRLPFHCHKNTKNHAAAQYNCGRS